MGYEVDFLPVGKSGHGGDAITLRIGDLSSTDRDDQFVAVIDGGYPSYGQAVVEHIQQHYATSEVDLVISTHPDHDHIGGLGTVIQELKVKQLWMHEPTDAEVKAVEAATFSATGERESRLLSLTASLGDSQDLASLARSLGIEVIPPWTGRTAADGALTVLGPTEEYYASLVPRFRGYTDRESLRSLVASGLEAKTGKAPGETLERETLEEGSRTEPENNSSVITLLQVDGRSVILTGDAGEEALVHAADHLDSTSFDWNTLRAMQIPHHGSRKNVGPSVLNRYLGEPVQTDRSRKTAWVSCAPNGAPDYPSRRVTNAFYRRGCRVFSTAGTSLRMHRDAPSRDTWTKADEIPFFYEGLD